MEQDLRLARIATFGALALVLGFYLLTLSTWNVWLSLLVAFVSAGLVTAVLETWLRLSLRRTAGPGQLVPAPQTQLGSVFGLQQKLLAAQTEKDILDSVLEFGRTTLQASGASFVPYDEWGQSLPATFQAEVPESALQSWSAQLRSPETRQACKSCLALHGAAGCGLVSGTMHGQPVRCFPLSIEQREAGVINFFFPADSGLPDSDTEALVRDAIQLSAQAITVLQAREQEIIALRYLQAGSAPKAQVPDQLATLLENVLDALDLDFALLYVPAELSTQADSPLLLSRARKGGPAEADSPDLSFLEGIWQSVLSSGKSVSLKNVTLNNREMWRVLLAIPLSWRAESPAGVLVLASNSVQSFSPRHLILLETIAAQAALLIQNAHLMMRVEYQAVVDERARLAREIHDGLAQTLAFLKIQAAQMQNYLSRGEMDRLTATLQANYRTLSDAYLDARQAIDNLRRVPSSNLRGWLEQVIADFEEGSGLKVDMTGFDLDQTFSPNIQAQLIRIIQESLSNVRKHARASHVRFVGREINQAWLIEIVDDGSGFSPDQLELSARHGLRGMRERAEMIGADFQIISTPGKGTTISLRLPSSIQEAL